jgi:hypothetical protein
VEQLKGSQLLSGLIYCNPFDGRCSPRRRWGDHGRMSPEPLAARAVIPWSDRRGDRYGRAGARLTEADVVMVSQRSLKTTVIGRNLERYNACMGKGPNFGPV